MVDISSDLCVGKYHLSNHFPIVSADVSLASNCNIDVQIAVATVGASVYLGFKRTAMESISQEEMYAAIARRDPAYEGIFVTAVKTTGIFCRPVCPARTPHKRNVEFFRSSQEALANGYRPCKRCKPLELKGQPPESIAALLNELESNNSDWLRDGDLRNRNLDPVLVRRWFKSNYGMTFQAYQRAVRLGRALRQINDGSSITNAAMDSGYNSLSGFEDAIRQFTGKSPSDSRDTSVVHIVRVLTPLGPMIAGATDDGICLLEFQDRRMLRTQLQRLVTKLNCTFVPGYTPLLRNLEDQLAEYFEGSRIEFDLPLIIPGSDFQKRVWTALGDVPFGETRSYLQQADAIGSPQSVRAVANANGANRIAIVIPCHRIIGSDGGLTGYGGGLWRKRWLLEHEGVTFKEMDQTNQAELFPG